MDSDETNIEAARVEDLPVYHASMLSQSVWEEVEVGELGRLLALTPNDVKSLAGPKFTSCRLQVFTTDRVPRPQPGHTLLSLLPKNEPDRIPTS